MSIYRSIAKLFILDEKAQSVADRIDTSINLCNKTMKRYGITTNDTDDSLSSDSDTDGIRPAEIGAEAVHRAGSKSANRKFA